MRARPGNVGAIAMALAALVSLETFGAGGQEPADVAGAWALEVNTEAGGTTTPSVTLEQEGSSLKGQYSSATLGEADVTGSVTGDSLTFSFEADLQGQAIEVTYSLTLQDDGTLTGSIDLGGFADGSVIGRRR